MRLRVSPRAARDIAEIGAYIRGHNPPAAVRVRVEIRRHPEILRRHPLAGRPVGRGLRRYAVPRLPYPIIYRLDDVAAEVAIVTIRHAARSPVV